LTSPSRQLIGHSRRCMRFAFSWGSCGKQRPLVTGFAVPGHGTTQIKVCVSHISQQRTLGDMGHPLTRGTTVRASELWQDESPRTVGFFKSRHPP
jgi:hypothetical protein